MSTQFITLVPPPGAALSAYDRTKRFSEQPISVPSAFKDAMSVREEVYVDEQGVPLENELDEDDARSWHWVVYASVANASSPPPEDLNAANGNGNGKKEEEQRNNSASASRVPVGTIRLIPPPHGLNPYLKAPPPVIQELPDGMPHDKHPDADPPSGTTTAAVHHKHPTEPYVKLGRLATLSQYRKLGLSKLLVNTALEWAATHPTLVLPPPDPTKIEAAKIEGKDPEEVMMWRGLCMVHAQVSVEALWAKHGFKEELIADNGEVEISKEGRWWEEGIEHLGMWKKLHIEDKYYKREDL